MAGDWIKMTTSLHENPRVVDIAEYLGLDELHVIGMLWRVWAWADTQTVSGEGMNITESRINRMVSCDRFCDALRAVGWLHGIDRDLSFTNFSEHNGETAKKRCLNRNRNQKYRNNKQIDDCDAMGCDDGDADSVTGVTQKASLEKRQRREENICLSKRETERKEDGVAEDEPTESSSLSRDTHISFGNSVGIPVSCVDVVAYLEGLECALPMSSRRAVAEAWYEEMLAKGWMLGKSRCRNWHAALQRKVRFVLEDRAHGLVRGGARNTSGFIPNDNANRGRSYEL